MMLDYTYVRYHWIQNFNREVVLDVGSRFIYQIIFRYENHLWDISEVVPRVDDYDVMLYWW